MDVTVSFLKDIMIGMNYLDWSFNQETYYKTKAKKIKWGSPLMIFKQVRNHLKFLKSFRQYILEEF